LITLINLGTTYFKDCPYHTNASLVGSINVEDNELDLITFFGVLHQIPNLSFAFCEIACCVKTDGVLFLREPVKNMRGWRFPKHGSTSRERGIPSKILCRIIKSSGLNVFNHFTCLFFLLLAATARVGVLVDAKQWRVNIDHILCQFNA
jgi:hypothetical protein